MVQHQLPRKTRTTTMTTTDGGVHHSRLSQNTLKAVAKHLGDFANEDRLLADNQELRRTVKDLLSNERDLELEADGLESKIDDLEDELAQAQKNADREKAADKAALKNSFDDQLADENDAHNAKLRRINDAIDALQGKHGINEHETRNRSGNSNRSAEDKLAEVDEFIGARKQSFSDRLADERSAHKASMGELRDDIERLTAEQDALNADLNDKDGEIADQKAANRAMREQNSADLEDQRRRLQDRIDHVNGELEDAKFEFAKKMNDAQVRHERETADLQRIIDELSEAQQPEMDSFDDEIERLQTVIGSLSDRQRDGERANRRWTQAKANRHRSSKQ